MIHVSCRWGHKALPNHKRTHIKPARCLDLTSLHVIKKWVLFWGFFFGGGVLFFVHFFQNPNFKSGIHIKGLHLYKSKRRFYVIITDIYVCLVSRYVSCVYLIHLLGFTFARYQISCFICLKYITDIHICMIVTLEL